MSTLFDEIEKLSPEERQVLEILLNEEGVDTSHLPIAVRGKQDFVPLSSVQSRFWFLQQLDSGNPVYNIAAAFRITGALRPDILEQSLYSVIARHEILRTTFPVINDIPCQAVHPARPLKIPVTDLCSLPEKERQARALSLMAAIAQKPFRMEGDSFVRTRLYRTGRHDFFLLIVSHHMVVDGWSMRIFMKELGAFYQAHTNSSRPALPHLPIQYADYTLWQQGSQNNAGMQQHTAYWKQKLDNASFILDLPTDHVRPAVETFSGSACAIEIPADLTRQLKALSRKEGVTLYMTLLSAFQVLLHRYCRQEDLVVGTAVANINRSEIENLIGSFSNNLVLRAQFHNNPTFREFLKQTRDTLIEAHEHQDLPFEKLLEEIRPGRDLSRNPLFQAAFIFHQGTLEQYVHIDELNFSSMPVDLGCSRFDITLEMDDAEDDLSGFLEYKLDLFEPQTIQRMAGHFLVLLKSIVDAPDTSVSALNMMSSQERERLLFEVNNTAINYPEDVCLHHLFEQQVLKSGTCIAVACNGKSLTYHELNSRANQLAHYLIQAGVTPESLVGICMQRCVDLPVALLGILKAGAAYVPMDPSFPPQRLEYMLQDARAPFLLTQTHLHSLFPGYGGKVLFLDQIAAQTGDHNRHNPQTRTDPQSLAYVIYTSGSTGSPNGVQIEHRCIVNFLLAMQQHPGITPADTVLAVTTISFDISVLELFLPLITGAQAIIADKATASDGALLLKLIEDSRATIMQATPATWRLMLEAGWQKTAGLTMLCGGEALPRDLAEQMLVRGDSLWNMYGPTETTIWSSVIKIESDQGPVLIGPPIANTRFYIVDATMHLVPAGVPGELLIGGDGLARGYVHKPELTRERFIKAPPFVNTDERLYKTGDLVRRRPGGCIEFLGRLDFQVKVRGFRIELGEIESCLAEHPDVQSVVVTALKSTTADSRLVAYIIPHQAKNLDAAELRVFLKKKLPDYMIPSLFVAMDRFALTPNGKTDRKALPEPETSALTAVCQHAEPDDELELQIAAIWKKTLNTQRIGVDDNFFEHGGHSLLAAKLFAQIERTFDRNLPLSTLFHAPTIRQIANILREQGWQPSWSSLVPIQTAGSRPPLFLMHGAEGNVLLYKDLAHCLGNDQPVYGLQSQGLDGSKPRQTCFESMAEHYIKEIKTVQPEGPYYLGGYCLGGAIAFEMARQLQQHNDKVALIAMLETYNIQEIPTALPFYYRLFHKAQNVAFHMANLFLSDPEDRHKFFKTKAAVEVSRWKIRSNILLSQIGRRLGRTTGLDYHHVRIDEHNDRLHAAYKPGPYGGTITLFRPKTHFAGLNDPCFGWGRLAHKGVDVVYLPMKPRGILIEPFVEMLAEKLHIKINETLQP